MKSNKVLTGILVAFFAVLAGITQVGFAATVKQAGSVEAGAYQYIHVINNALADNLND